jgi:hypothetical protein
MLGRYHECNPIHLRKIIYNKLNQNKNIFIKKTTNKDIIYYKLNPDLHDEIVLFLEKPICHVQKQLEEVEQKIITKPSQELNKIPSDSKIKKYDIFINIAKNWDNPFTINEIEQELKKNNIDISSIYIRKLVQPKLNIFKKVKSNDSKFFKYILSENMKYKSNININEVDVVKEIHFKKHSSILSNKSLNDKFKSFCQAYWYKDFEKMQFWITTLKIDYIDRWEDIIDQLKNKRCYPVDFLSYVKKADDYINNIKNQI